MSTLKSELVKQLLPADDWYAVWAIDGRLVPERLVAWALYERTWSDGDRETDITGVELEELKYPRRCDETYNAQHLGYIHERDLGKLDEWFQEKLAEHVAHLARTKETA